MDKQKHNSYDIKTRDVLQNQKSAQIIIESLAPLREGKVPGGTDDLLDRLLSSGQTCYDRHHAKLIRKIKDPTRIKDYTQQAAEFLNYLKIDRGQLGFVEQVMNLEGITVRTVLPQGGRAALPIMAFMGGPRPDFNRVTIQGGIPGKESLEEQTRYLTAKLGRPTIAASIECGNYFTYEKVGRNALAHVYLLLDKHHINTK
ncbi:MAG: hypothetical protein V1645_01060 [archaeon]